mmetsp:Transcript_4764/g.10180  ORF Transcript_4764/g.10180 Transcript_4764/m.10180 type:complete len:173 (-) Transcript_4764:168-686(-)
MQRKPISAVKTEKLNDFYEKLKNATEVRGDDILPEDENLFGSSIQSPPMLLSPYRKQIENMLSLSPEDSCKQEAAARKEGFAEFCLMCKSATEDGCLCLMRKNAIVFHNLGLTLKNNHVDHSRDRMSRTVSGSSCHKSTRDVQENREQASKERKRCWWRLHLRSGQNSHTSA